MTSITAALLVSVVMVRHCHCWAFTEVKYSPRLLEGARNAADPRYNEISNNEEENELSPLDSQERISLIFPGTKWCGAGDVAQDYDDLGSARETDKCCREHDHCNDTITAGDTMHNLTNNAFYTRLSCECDERFRLCLHSAHQRERTARKVGLLYFDAIGTECFREDYPVTGCSKRGGFLNNKCVRYEYDASAERLYQWFDVPLYSAPSPAN